MSNLIQTIRLAISNGYEYITQLSYLCNNNWLNHTDC